MDDLFSQLEPASYNGLVFPVLMTTLKTSSVVAKHQFPHRPGIRLEYMGRDPVMGSMTALMFNSLPFEKRGPRDLWPQTTQLLRILAQDQVSYPLVLPTLGTLPKAHITITERYDATKRDGCYVDIEFVEDNEDLISTLGVTSARSKVESLSKSLENISFYTHTDTSTLEQDTSNAQAVLKLKLLVLDEQLNENNSGFVDIATAINGLIFALNQTNENLARPFGQAGRIVDSLSDLLSTTTALGDPDNWAVRDAILELQDSVSQLVRESAGVGRTISKYITPAAMDIMKVAITTKNTIEELLGLNSIPDPTKIPGGEFLLVYEK